MKSNRRNFIKAGGLAGLGLTGISKVVAGDVRSGQEAESRRMKEQKFNMCGYAAPKINTVRVGFIGLGSRGPTHMVHTSKLEGVEIKALCDLRPEQVDSAYQKIAKTTQKPTFYTGHKEEWKKLCDRSDIDLIYIATPWDLHTPMAVHAMEQGKHVCIEVPAAVTLDECWQLVETSERTRRHCMMLENCCYDFFELLTLNMARAGFFGEIVHAEGAYIHTLSGFTNQYDNFSKDGYWDMWRLKQNTKRNGNLYPTHGLGPVSQVLNINRGDKMDYLVSMSGNDFSMGRIAAELAAKDDFYKPYVNQTYRGNMNTTAIRTNKGKTIMIQHDVSTPRVYSRIHLVSGTKGAALKYPLPGRISVNHHDWIPETEFKELEAKYQPVIVKKIGEMAKQVGGHGGMDFLMNWRTIDCLRNGLALDEDVYDAALWSAISPLSEWSVAHRSNSVDVPDFTRGSWKKNQPVDISLEKGGTTGIKA